jgi:hypothetical protein
VNDPTNLLTATREVEELKEFVIEDTAKILFGAAFIDTKMT